MALSKVVIHNIMMFMRRDAVSNGDEAVAYCQCMDALKAELDGKGADSEVKGGQENE